MEVESERFLILDNVDKQNVIDRIKELTEPIFKKYGVNKTYVFGSYARGDFDDDSDVEIIIVAKNIKSLLIIGAILETLKQVLNKEVDLIEKECFENNEIAKTIDRFAHGYGKMDLNKIFYTAIEDIPTIKEFLEQEIEKS